MGFLKKLFFGEDKPKTELEKQVEEQIKENPQYAQAQVTNIPTCNGCGGDIEGNPRLQKHQGKLMYFHKRCFKALKRGQLPKAIPQTNEQSTGDQ